MKILTTFIIALGFISSFAYADSSFEDQVCSSSSKNVADEDTLDNTTFTMMKILILKNLWNEMDADDQYTIMSSDKCDNIGLNRLPIHKGLVAKKSLHDLDKVFNICMVESLEQLIPYADKTTILETFLTLKSAFPSNISSLSHTVCEQIKDRQDSETIILSEDKSFISWLSLFYKNQKIKSPPVQSNIKLQKEIKENIKKNFQEKDRNNFSVLNNEEKKTLTYYTGEGYWKFNTCLRSSKCTEAEKAKINLLNKTLKKLNVKKPEAKILFRGVRSLPTTLVETLDNNPKDYVVDQAFSSASGSASVAKVFDNVIEKNRKGYLFIMKTKSCVGVAQTSINKSEDEFLCPPGLKYNVTKKGNRYYLLEEV